MHHKIILMNYCFVCTIEIDSIFVTFYLMVIKIKIWKKCTFCQSGHGFMLLPHFFKVLAFSQFLMYADEIDMI